MKNLLKWADWHLLIILVSYVVTTTITYTTVTILPVLYWWLLWMVVMGWICLITVLADSCGFTQCQVSIRVIWHSGVHACHRNVIVLGYLNLEGAWWWFGQTSLLWAELTLKLHHVAQGCVWWSLLCLQGWRSHNLSGQFLLLFNQPCCEEFFSLYLTRISCSATCCFLSAFHCAESSLVFFLQFARYVAEDSNKIPSLAFFSPGQTNAVPSACLCTSCAAVP